ncbi:MAG: 9-O-acetylesterase [Planctomycetota bacterium]|nr:MAG: 9-O-acetylesterase [Planctomycetota bacterium]
MRLPSLRLCLLVLAPVLTASANSLSAQVRLPALFSDHMVLQQDREVPIWGWAAPQEGVFVKPSWTSKAYFAQADQNGRWQRNIPTPKAGGPFQIQILASNQIVLHDVLVGEVWICSGQSNMEWPMTRIDRSAEEIANAVYPEIRLFDVPNRLAVTPAEDVEATWSACQPDSVRSFSAVAYFFARKLHHELGVPVGLVAPNWGGTVAETWTSRQTLEQKPWFAAGLKDVAQAAQDPETFQKGSRAKVQAWWKSLERKDPGSKQGWSQASFSDQNWESMELPGNWDRLKSLQNFDGVLWYRRSVSVPQDWAGKALVMELGPIDDMDATWFQGHKVGEHQKAGQWQTPRKYSIPARLVKAGENLIAVRVLDTGGAGGFHGNAENLRLYPKGNPQAAISLAGSWRYHKGTAMGKLGPVPTGRRIHQNYPTVLFNGMLKPLIPFAIRGAIWYQGESNRTRAYQYRELFPAMIQDWRQHWQQGDFPFYFVQIAPFAYGKDQGQAAELREAQYMTSRSVPNSGMVVTMDIGNPRDIHPTNKQEVGRRLALLALHRDYGYENLVSSGPQYRDFSIEGSRIRLFFDSIGGGLQTGGNPLSHFTMAGEDRVFHPAQATIEADSIVVWSEAVANPVAVRYAWGAADEPNLRNAEGLPASSFRTDSWPGLTEPKP